jgi:hypothetical protein
LKRKGVAVFHIVKSVVDAHGVVVTGGPLPVSFDSEVEAREFLDRYPTLVFAGGKCGRQPEGAFWWGCDETPDLHLHRYTIEH